MLLNLAPPIASYAIPSPRHRFIRATFTDESLVGFFHAMSEDTLHHHMASVLRDGIFVAGRKYVYLAYSKSQLRDQSCWMYDERQISLMARRLLQMPYVNN